MSVHDLLKELSPCDFESIPQDEQGLAKYIQDAIAKTQELVDSVPPPSSEAPSSSKGASAAANVEGIRQTGATSDAPVNEEMRKAWGKPLKLSAKDNPHEMGVYKMAAKDRRGAWFARRSVHEGLGFARWKQSLDTEFEHSLQVHGKPGEGNVRGIGGDKKLTSKTIPDAGTIQVLQLTAQFPGPSAPRDFVELLISSTQHPTNKDAPRQYLLISKPVTHSDAPEQQGFVRGTYESIEFIREIPIRKTKMMSTTSLPATRGGAKDDKKGSKADELKQTSTGSQLLSAKSGHISAEDAEAFIEARQAQDNVSPTSASNEHSDKESNADSGVAMAVDENDELAPNPVEWIMITRSDPGGSVPRFMVERGTPGTIVADAGKFLNWATQRSMPVVNGDIGTDDTENQQEKDTSTTGGEASTTKDTTAVTAAQRAHRLTRTVTVASTSSSSSSDSFVSADSVTPTPKVPQRVTSDSSTGSAITDKFDHQEHELTKKLEIRKAKADLKLEESKERHVNREDKIQQAEEKRDRKHQEAQQWHEKQLVKVQHRRERAEKRQRESGSKSELRAKIDGLTKENDELRRRIAELETK